MSAHKLQSNEETNSESQVQPEKKNMSKKKRFDIDQTTKVNSRLHQKQTSLKTFFKINSEIDSVSNKSEEYLNSQTSYRIQFLEEELLKKEQIIAKLKSDNSKRNHEVFNMEKDLQIFRRETKEAIIKTTRQIAEDRRKQKGTINIKLGFYNASQFVEGDDLKKLRKQLKEAQQMCSNCQKTEKSSLTQEEKNNLAGRTLYFKQEVKELQEELSRKQKQLTAYKERLKFYFKEKQTKMARDNWPILKQRYLPTELLGSGGFGEVYKGFDIQKMSHVAIKLSSLESNLTSNQNFIKHINRQIQIHKQLKHPNIVRVLDQLQLQDGRLGLVMEYCSGPQLKSYLKKAGCLPERQAKQIIRQIVYAVKYLHDQRHKVIHYDLKPANILFHQGIIKVVDFGICKTVENEEDTKIDLTSPNIGTCWYLPPESFDHHKVISSKVDVYSIGVIFYQLLYGVKPIGHGIRPERILREGLIQNGVLEFPSDSPKRYKISKQAQNFIRMSMQKDVQKRMSSSQAYSHDYMNWQ